MDNIKSLNVPPFTTFNSIMTISLLVFFLRDCCILQIAATKSSTIPIWVATKPKCPKWSKNIFYDNHGLLDKTDDYDNFLYNIKGGVIL